MWPTIYIQKAEQISSEIAVGMFIDIKRAYYAFILSSGLPAESIQIQRLDSLKERSLLTTVEVVSLATVIRSSSTYRFDM